MAEKYNNDKNAAKKAIVSQVVHGGRGQWARHTGGAIMPPYTAQTTEAQRNDLAEFILNLDPVAPPN